jgi:4-carboxymuconolactone decarboxylase
MSDEEKLEQGVALAQRLFEGVGGGTRLPKRFRDYTMSHLFGDVWQGDELELEERELVTSTILVALNRTAEQRLHFTAAKNLGIPRTKIEGMIAHAAHYAGWPCAVSAFGVLNEVWPE